MRGEVLGEHVVDGDIEAARGRHVLQAAHDVIGIAVAIAPEHAVALARVERLPLDGDLAQALPRRAGDRKRHLESLETHEPPAKAFRRVPGKRVFQLALEPVTNLRASYDSRFEDRIDRKHAPEVLVRDGRLAVGRRYKWWT